MIDIEIWTEEERSDITDRLHEEWMDRYAEGPFPNKKEFVATIEQKRENLMAALDAFQSTGRFP